MNTKRLIATFIILTIVLLFLLAPLPWRIPSGRTSIDNIVLISIDTCRADHLSCYGYPRQTTPVIDSIAQQGVLFERVISPVPLTLPAHSSIMTGTIPPYHGVHHNLEYKLGQSNITLAEILKEHKYQTGAVISAAVLESKYGLDQGFDDYLGEFIPAFEDGSHAEQKGNITSDKACKWLGKNSDDPFFLFLHYYDPHDLYQAPQPFASRFADDPYAAEIAYTDHCIGRVVEKLKELDLYDSTLIVITSDHGEMLGEHGEETHGYFVYQSAVHVPLIVKLPGSERGRCIKDTVALVDIMPTILNLLNIETPERTQGLDLSEYINGDGSGKQRFIYCESMMATDYNCNPLIGVVNWPWKYIYTTRPELYNCEKDPMEKNDLAGSDELQCKKMLNRLQFILDENLRADSSDSRLELNKGDLDKLQSLGYVGTGVEATFTLDMDKPDPKDWLKLHEQNRIMLGAILAEEFDEAEKICTDMLEQRPNIPFLHETAGRIAWKKGNFKRAIEHYQNYLEFKPDDCKSRNNMATAMDKIGEVEQAIEQWQRILKDDPDYYHAHENIALTFYNQGNLNKAVEHWLEAVRIEPDNTDILNNLAWILAASKDDQLHDPKKALDMAKRMCELSEYDNPTYLDTLAVAYAANGQFLTAIETASKAISQASTVGNTRLSKNIQNRIELYRQNKPYRD